MSDFDPLRTYVPSGTRSCMSVKVRTAVAADVGAMHAVRIGVRQNRLSDPGRISETAYLPYIAAGSAWVAEDHAGITGFAAIDGRAGTVWALFVDPRAEGAGVGRALHRRMLEWARDQNIGHLSLSTEPISRAAHFYMRAGWRQAGMTQHGELMFQLG